MQDTLDDWAREALSCLAAEPGVRRVGIALTEGGGRRLDFTASDRGAGGQVDWCTIDAFLDVPLNTAIATAEPVAGPLAELAGRYPDFVGGQPEGTTGLAAVPLRSARQVLGGFVLYFATPQEYDEPRIAHWRALGARLGERLRDRQRGRVRVDASLSDQPVPAGARAATFTVPDDPAAVRDARSRLRTTLAGWDVPPEESDSAVLLLSELVTNALIHTWSGCEVQALLDEAVLTVRVRDRGHGEPGRTAGREPLLVHGRGLHIVEALATRWGSELDDAGTTVWFTLDTRR